MAKRMCSACGYQIDVNVPPQRCPSCHQGCSYIDVTCYIPDCGGESNVNPLVIQAVRKQKEPKFK